MEKRGANFLSLRVLDNLAGAGKIFERVLRGVRNRNQERTQVSRLCSRKKIPSPPVGGEGRERRLVGSKGRGFHAVTALPRRIRLTANAVALRALIRLATGQKGDFD